MDEFTTGQITDLDDLLYHCANMVQSVMDVVFTGCLLFYFVGWAALVGLAFLILWVPINLGLAFLSASLRDKAMTIVDRRLLQIKELLEAIRIVKANAWEWVFRDKIRAIRG